MSSAPEVPSESQKDQWPISGFYISTELSPQMRLLLPSMSCPFIRRDQSLLYVIHRIYCHLPVASRGRGHAAEPHHGDRWRWATQHYLHTFRTGHVLTGSSCTSPQLRRPLRLYTHNPWRISHTLRGSRSSSLQIKWGHPV